MNKNVDCPAERDQSRQQWRMRMSSSTVIVLSGPGPSGKTSWRVSRGLEFDSIRFRYDDKHPAYFAGQIKESRNSAGMGAPSPRRTAILTKQGHRGSGGDPDVE